MAPPGAALADDDGDVRRAELQARLGGAGDRLRLAARLRVDAGIGAGRVDQREHRHVETVGELHHAHRLAVALRPRHAEIVLEAGLRVLALLLREDRDRIAAKAAEAGDDRLVLAELSVAGERLEIGDEAGDVVLCVRPVGMAGDLRLLPGRQPGIDAGERVARLALERRDLVGDRDAVGARLQPPQLLDLAFEVGDRLFEVEVGSHRAPCAV